jgi:hypothetical protein
MTDAPKRKLRSRTGVAPDVIRAVRRDHTVDETVALLGVSRSTVQRATRGYDLNAGTGIDPPKRKPKPAHGLGVFSPDSEHGLVQLKARHRTPVSERSADRDYAVGEQNERGQVKTWQLEGDLGRRSPLDYYGDDEFNARQARKSLDAARAAGATHAIITYDDGRTETVPL